MLGNKDEALAPGLETAVRAQANHFPGGASVVRCEMVLGARGCDEAFQYRNHPLAYFFERFARNRMAPIPGAARRPVSFLTQQRFVIVERTGHGTRALGTSGKRAGAARELRGPR